MLRVLVEHDLPRPAIEFVAGPRGEYRLDFAYPAVKLAIEVDGYIWHFTPEQQHRDHERRRRLFADGWTVLVFTWTDVTQRPQRVAAEIRAALISLGAND
jgi:very-short-patch-repair endonuclease